MTKIYIDRLHASEVHATSTDSHDRAIDSQANRICSNELQATNLSTNLLHTSALLKNGLQANEVHANRLLINGLQTRGLRNKNKCANPLEKSVLQVNRLHESANRLTLLIDKIVPHLYSSGSADSDDRDFPKGIHKKLIANRCGLQHISPCKSGLDASLVS